MSVSRNYSSNPTFETSTATLTAVPGTTGVCAAPTNPAVATAFGTKVAHVQWTTASTAAGGGAYVEYDLATVGLVVGDIISLGIYWLLASIANRLQLSAEFRTNVGTISTTTGTAKQVAAGTAQAATNKLAGSVDPSWKLENLTVPATATKLRVRLLSVAGTGYANWSIASYLRLKALQVNKGATLHDYVDGSLGSLYAWDGTAHASTSAMYVPVVQATAIADDNAPGPRILVTFDDLPPTVTSLTVYRDSDRRTWKTRGAVDVVVAGGFSLVDVEAPFGVVSTYRAQMFLGTADGGYTSTASATCESDVPWIHNPLEPGGAAQIDVDHSSARSLVRPTDGSLEHAENRVLGIVVAGPRRGLKGVQLMLSTDSLEVADALQTMLGGYDENDQKIPVLCIRTPRFDRLPRTFFAAVFSLEEKPVTVHMGGTLIEFSAGDVNEASPPFPGLIIPLLTRDDIDASFASRNAIDAAYLRRLDVDRDYSKAGTA